MASTVTSLNKIKEGLLQISWDAPRNNRVGTGMGYVHPYNVSHNIGKPTQTQINVSTLITKCFDTCVLTCKMEGQQIILEMEIQITPVRKF